MAKEDSRALLRKSILVNVLLSFVVVVLAIAIVWMSTSSKTQYITQSTTTIAQTNSSTLAQQSANTLAGIDQPLNTSELAAINDAPLSYYQYAGERLLNGTLTDAIVTTNAPQYNAIIINGKPSVIYIGAISCIFCGENRWSMALALATFGNFTQLFNGYSSFGDGDVPTLYWNQDNYTTSGGVGYGNFYNSKYINFISSDYESPITQGFEVGPLSFFVAHSPNATYSTALKFMNGTGAFEGTPFALWGTSLDAGADAVIFGNNSNSAPAPLNQETHAQILSQLASFNDQFAWAEFAGADVYISQVCPAINNSAPVCALPAIKAIGAKQGLVS